MNLQTDTTCFNETQLNYPAVNLVDNKVALPLHIQNLEKALNLNTFLKQVHSLIDDKRDEKLNLTISKQQSKDIKSSIYSFNKTGKNKNWLKNILIDNSDESDSDEIGQQVDQLLKIRKNYKKTNKSQFSTGLGSNLLSLNDSIPLNTLFKNEKTCKSQLKKKKTTTNSKKKLKSDSKTTDKLNNDKLDHDKPNDRLDDRLNHKLNDELDRLNDLKEDDKYQLTNYFEPTLNSKSFKSFNKHDNDLIEAGCLDSKLLDDYESTLPDDILQSEANMNDFVNSFLTDMNDHIVYSNQLPDEIFETEEEISNGFQSSAYDLNKFTNHDEIIVESANKVDELNPAIISQQSNDQQLDQSIIEPTVETIVKPIDETNDKEDTAIHLVNGSTIDTTTTISSTATINQNLITNSIVNLTAIDQTASADSQIILNSIVNTCSSTAKAIDSNDAIKLNKIVVKKKEKTSKSLLDMEPEQIQNKRRKLWSTIVKKDIPKAYKSRLTNRKDILNNCKKLATCCQRERKNVIGIPKLNKERSKKSNKEMATYKRNDNQETVKQHHLLPKLNETIATTTATTIIISESNQEIQSNCLL